MALTAIRKALLQRSASNRPRCGYLKQTGGAGQSSVTRKMSAAIVQYLAVKE